MGFVRRVLIGAYEDDIPFLASALTFDALLAAIPFVLLMLASLGYLVQTGEDAVTDVLATLAHFLPSERGGSDDTFQTVQRLVTDIVESRAQLSVYGIPLFLWFSTRFFSGARSALNNVFDTEESRPYFVGKGIDLILVIVTLVLIIASTLLTVLVANYPWFGRFVASLSTFGVGVLLFFVAYTILPSRRVRWDTAVVAAAVASLGFEIAKKLYALYLAEFATIDRLISNANAIALLLLVLWIYFIACVFLLGGEVAETYDLMRRQREQRAILA